MLTSSELAAGGTSEELLMASKVRWGIVGPGSIAREFADALRISRTGELVAIGTRNPDRPGLAADFPEARIVAGYDALLADAGVDAVYVATPHISHAEWSIKAAQSGKHVLVEKPMAINLREAEAMFDAARTAGTFMGEAFMYRFHPMTQKLAELVASGVIGEVRMIQSNFGIQMEEFKPDHHRLYAKELAGGGILDIGCYPVSMARFIAGAAAGKPFLDPVGVFGTAHLSVEGVDDWSSATLNFNNGIIAQLNCAVSVALDNMLRIHGSTGWLEVREFWSAGGNREGDDLGKIHIVREEGPRETITTEGQGRLYVYEADAVGEAIAAGRQEFAAPGPNWADSFGNMRVLDAWRAGAGLVYESEKPGG
jgi:predicted dehydrogenase